MRTFRPVIGSPRPAVPFAPLELAQVIDDAMQPGNFFVAPDARFTWIAARAETIRWEIFRGRLVDSAQTRLQKGFLCWQVFEGDPDHAAAEPTVSVKLDVQGKEIHVTRGLLAYVWEGYDSGGGTIESREVVKWTRELVGTMRLSDFSDLESVRDELICLIWQALVGTSRLPLHSVEAPLPAFSFGQLHYLYQSEAGAEPCVSWEDWLARGLNSPCAWRETVKLVEFMLRRPPTIRLPRLDELLGDARPAPAKWRRRLMSSLFNEVSLSPHTHFLDSALAYVADLSPLLRKICRHLTAYDLVTFHHRGANYPDALLLDASLRRFISELEMLRLTSSTDDADGRWLRRSLRQACLMRRHYEGHLVPDAPTSPGENARLVPASHPRVPEVQLTQTTQRRRQLFASEPLTAMLSPEAIAALAQSVADLVHVEERIEMGLGLFIDRPLGYGKQVGEPDLTPILAHEAFSPSLARQRWQKLKKLCAELHVPVDAARLDPLFENGPWPAGLPHTQVAECPRPVAALGDVRKVASDFVILRTLPNGLGEMLRQIGLGDLVTEPRLCVPALDAGGRPVIALYDQELLRRVELTVDASKGYVTRAGVELPRAGVRVQ